MSSISPHCYHYILHMRIFTRQHRELNDDSCEINIITILWQLMRGYIRARRSTNESHIRIINTTKCATDACCSTHTPNADDLSSRVVYWHLAFDQSAGTPVSGILRLANVQSRPVGIHMSSWHSNVQCHHVAPVTPSHAQSRPVTPSGARLHLVAVRSHFGLRLGGRINPARASNRSR